LTRRPSKREYSQFRKYLETLSERVRILRNHFYNHAFNDGTLLKVADVRKIAEEMCKLVEPYDT
jgi:hypothetical protein